MGSVKKSGKVRNRVLLQGYLGNGPFPVRDWRLAFPFQPGTGYFSSLSSQGHETCLPFPVRDTRLVFPFKSGTGDLSSLSSQGQDTFLPFPVRDRRLVFPFQSGTGDLSSLSNQGQETCLPFRTRDRRLVFPFQSGTGDLSLKVVRCESKTQSFVIQNLGYSQFLQHVCWNECSCVVCSACSYSNDNITIFSE